MLIVGLVTACCASSGAGQGPAEAGRRNASGQVLPQVAVVMDTPTPELAFTVTNLSAEPIPDGGIDSGYNSVTILLPNGSVTGLHMSVEGTGGTSTIPPGASKTRTESLAALSERAGLRFAGVYRGYWDAVSYTHLTLPT